MSTGRKKGFRNGDKRFPQQTLQMTKSEGCIVIEFGPEAKAFLGALIRAIVVDPDDIKDPVVRGFLKFSESR